MYSAEFPEDFCGPAGGPENDSSFYIILILKNRVIN